MPYFLEGNCVRKGTKEEPGEVVKCHEDHAAAVAHLKALYANVEDAGKGGTGSGWHSPPEGTHDAEHAPNFRGGPGADREYGTESDEPPKGSKRCKCSKCGAVIVLPKGKQCEDIKCPSCGRGSTQEVPREDKPAEGEGGRNPKAGREKQADEPCPCEDEKAMDAPGPTIHGSGGAIGETASVMDDGEGAECKCPHCGKSLPCTAKACPYCKKSIDKVERSEMDTDEKRVMKSEGDGQHPASHYLVVEDPEKPSTWHLRVRNASGKLDHGLMGGAWAALHGGYRGNKYEGPNKSMALAKLKKLYEQEGLDTPGEKSAWTIYKSATGEWRWLTLSNWSVVDKESEVVSEQAYRDAIAYAQETGEWGQLDLVHVNGTDVGDCDQLFILKGGDDPAKFGAGGTWYDTAKATRAREAIQAEPEAWGVSIKFRFNPQRKVGGIYTGDIQVLKHSILPQEMAASFGTAIAVQEGKSMSKQLDDKAAEALRKLGHSEDEIAELAEKQKALPEEENVVEKEDSATGEQPEPTAQPGAVKQFVDAMRELLGVGRQEVAPVASEPVEAGKADEVTEPASAVEPAENEKAEGDEPDPTPEVEQKAEPGDAGALIRALGETVAKSIGEMVKSELEVRDKRIADLEAQVQGLSESVEEKVEQRLRDLPQVVKVAASEVAATAVPDEKPKGLTFGQPPQEMTDYTKALMADIERVVKDKMAGAQFKV